MVSGDIIIDTDDGKIIVDHVIANGTITTKTSDAGIHCSQVSCESMLAETSDDKVKLEEDTMKRKLNIESSYGGIVLNHVIAPESLTVKTSDGDIIFERIQSDDIELWDNYGNIKGSIEGKLADYSITSKTSSDYENSLPSSMDGGDKRLNVKTSDGKINVNFIQ